MVMSLWSKAQRKARLLRVKIVTSKLRAQVFEARVADWPRILPSRHRSTPANAGFGSSRFSSPSLGVRIDGDVIDVPNVTLAMPVAPAPRGIQPLW